VDSAEIGGGENWWRRFTIQVTNSYAHLGYSQDEARQYANTVFQRVRQSLRTNYITGSDDFGESVQDIYPKVRWEERYPGGSEVEWMWEGFLGIQVFTSVS